MAEYPSPQSKVAHQYLLKAFEVVMQLMKEGCRNRDDPGFAQRFAQLTVEMYRLEEAYTGLLRKEIEEWCERDKRCRLLRLLDPEALDYVETKLVAEIRDKAIELLRELFKEDDKKCRQGKQQAEEYILKSFEIYAGKK